MRAPSLPIDTDMYKMAIAKTRDTLTQPAYNGILEDLVGFTGLSEDEVLFRVARKSKGIWGARGWFWDEWMWHNPTSDNEIMWFYKSSQSYLFSSARHPYWDMLDIIPTHCRDVFDFGCGVGTNTIELAKRGFDKIRYYDLSLIQTEFMRYRVDAHDLGSCVSICDIGSGDVDVVIAQDVLEHIPNYSRILIRLIDMLKPGGYILERSPFRQKYNRNLEMHLPADVLLPDIMAQNNMDVILTRQNNTKLWQKK